MAALVTALRRHFGGDPNAAPECGAGAAPECGGGGVGDGAPNMGRAIVFTNLRESVSTILETLAPHAPLIKPRYLATIS